MHGQTQKIRNLVNIPTIQQTLKKDGVLWNQMCSCLDVIEDTELAINTYFNKKCGESAEECYLAVYGLLQALFVQQDAVINLCESLGIPNPLNRYPQLGKIRKVRNDSVGHPTRRGAANKPSYHFISRPTLTHDGFQHLSIDSNGKLDFEDISIPDLIKDQEAYLSEILKSVIVELEQKKQLKHAQT